MSASAEHPAPAKWPYYLLPAIPLALLLNFVFHAPDTFVFLAAALGVIPTAALMGLATEELAARSGPGIGGFLNVTFGNAPELIIALFALSAGLQEVVKASIVGSILGNVLLVLGASMLVGGWKRKKQTFNHTAASVQSITLFLACAALLMPAVYAIVNGEGLPAVGDVAERFSSAEENIAIAMAAILLFTYAVGLFFSLKTHKDIFNPVDEAGGSALGWSAKKAAGVLALAGVLVGLMSEVLVHSIEGASESIGLSPFFVGIIVVAIVGNAAEHWVAVLFAMRNKMDLAVNIAIGSASQIALFVAPVLVLASLVLGPFPMALVFNGYELVAMLLSVLAAYYVTQEGESTWFEGVQLLALYALLGVVFFFA